jgi:HEAT repeat protein
MSASRLLSTVGLLFRLLSLVTFCVVPASAADHAQPNILAELASMLEPAAIPTLKQAMSDGDSAVRYWGTLGILIRGKAAVDGAGSELLTALKDFSLTGLDFGQNEESPPLRISLSIAEVIFR